MKNSTPAPYICIKKGASGYLIEGLPHFFCGYRDLVEESGKRNGCYAAWEWDGLTLHIESRPYGFVPLYYGLLADGICVSTSIHQLFEHGVSRTIDDTAVATFIRFGYYFGEDTAFRDIRTIPPSGDIKWSDGEIAQHDEIAPIPVDNNIGRTEAKAIYQQLFSRAVASCNPSGDFAVPLSGGRDSRHILFELMRQGRPPAITLTNKHFPPKSNEDAHVAKAIAAELGVPHLVLQQPTDLRHSELRKNIATSFGSIEHAWMLPLIDYLGTVQTKPVFDGIAGDVLSAGLFLDEKLLTLWTTTHDRSSVARYIVKRWSNETAIKNLLSPALYERFRPSLVEYRITQELSKWERWHNPVTAFYFFNRTRRAITVSAFSLHLPDRISYCPYLDVRVVEFLFSLPASMMLSKAFHTETISEAYPEFAHLAYEKSGGISTRKGFWRKHYLSHLRDVVTGRTKGIGKTSWLVPKLVLGAAFATPKFCWLPLGLLDYLMQLSEVAEAPLARGK